MWQWKPAKSIASDLATRSAASRALPFDTVKPNFESSAPVAMYSWVCASTPGVTRTNTRAGAAPFAGDERLDAVELVERVGDDAPDAALERELQLGVRLVVAVEHDAGRGEAGVERELQLAAGGDVEVQPLVGHEAGHGARRGTPCPRTRPRRRRTRRGTRRRGRAARSRSTRRAACRARARARRGRHRRSTAGRVVDRRGARQQPEVERGARRGDLTTRRLVVVVEARHLVGRVHAEDRERAGETEAARLRQPEPRLRERGVVGDHPAVAVEAVERLGEVAHPRGDAVRCAQRGRLGEHARVRRERAEELELALVHERRERRVEHRQSRDAHLDRLATDRRDAGVRVLHVVDGILHRLRGDDVEVERLAGVDALQQEGEPRDVGVDLVEDVGERDDVAGALRDADRLTRLHQLHQLTEQHLGLTLGVARAPPCRPAATSPGRGGRRPRCR